MPRILIVEDDPNIRMGLEDNLAFEGYSLSFATEGGTGLEKALKQPFDLILLDIKLPKMDGYELCQNLRKKGINTPVIMLTARTQQFDKIHGFKVGADDYVTKPFDILELVSRIKAVLRRTAVSSAEKPFAIGQTVIDPSKCEATKNGKPLELTPRDIDLLVYLHRRRGMVVSRRELLDKIWGEENYPTTRTVDNHVVRIRSCIEEKPSEPKYLLSIRGKGYKLAET